MIHAVPLTPELAKELLFRPEMAHELTQVRMDNLEKVCAEHKHSFAILNESYEVIACGGVIEAWADRGQAWAFFRPDAGKYFLAIHKFVLSFLDSYPFKRIEATVDRNFPRGNKWVMMLNFNLEAPCLAQYREGRDYALYSRIKP